ncbi:MAG: DUF1232 domain-containing protein [Gemmatimonadaceae bacterium]
MGWSRPALDPLPAASVRQLEAPEDVSGRERLSVVGRLLEYVRLVGRLMLDARVSLFDRLIVVAAVAYVVSPIDLIPDVIPFLGEVDDVMVLIAALTRLFEHAGREVILSHWRGTADQLDARWLKKLAFVFSVFFPKASRQRLRRFARG